MNRSKFGERLLTLCVIEQITQKELAEKLGITQPTVNRWMKGECEPNFSKLLSLCEVFCVSPNFLLGFENGSFDRLCLKRHFVKITPQYFEAVLNGIKTFEVRYNDRNYKVGDTLILREFQCCNYTGREIEKRIVYILDDSKYCKEGFVILGLK